jgi:dipeptidyl aminopeptidase/acylaminoacyl peptidase
VFALALIVALGAAYAWPSAQTAAKKALTVEDYPKWKSITASELSSDGTWVSYGVSFSNTATADAKPVVHLLKLETNEHVEIANATGGTFSADAKWFAYTIDPGAGRGGRGARGGGGATPGGSGATPATQPGQAGRGAESTPPAEPRRVELRNLATGAVRSWQDIQSFTFSPNSTHLVLRRRPPTSNAAGRAGGGGEPGGGGAQAAGPAAGTETPSGPRGVDVTVHNLATGRDQLLGSVGDMAFNRTGELFAYTVDAAALDANGLFVLVPGSGRVHPIDNDKRRYNRLVWNEEGGALAVLKGVDVEKMRERDNQLLVVPDVRESLEITENGISLLDPAKTDNFPKGWVISDRAALTWSADGKRVYFGIKEQVPAPRTNARRNADEEPDVDVWNTRDERIQSVQMVRADTDRNFTYRQGFDVAAGKFIKLADDTMRDLDIAPSGRWAVGRDTRGYIHDYRRPAADLYRVDTATGERTLIVKNHITSGGIAGFSPDGRHLLLWKDSRYHAYDLDAGALRPLGGSAANFTDMEFDRPGPRPAYGIAGYTNDGRYAIAQHRYDLWLLPLDGSAPRNLTNSVGTKNEIRFRYVRTTPIDPLTTPLGAVARQTIDLSKPVTLTAFGEWTKKAGFYELANGQLKEIVYEDASFSTPTKALKADVYLFTRQSFIEFPDLRVSGPNLKDSKKITDVNPQQTEYLWGRRILFDFKNKDGVRLQGILALPDDYRPGEKRPMLVTFYEKNSQNLNRYSAPSYLSGMGSSPMQAVSEGYITMLPDIHFRTGASHSDMLECVEAAVKRVIEMGYVDPKRIGISGHSYGGEGAAFIGTRSKLFAAVGVGAGVTELYSDFNMNWGWAYGQAGGSGANGHDYYLFGQGREAVSPWDAPEMYRSESAITHAPMATAPFLIMHGTADPTVSFVHGLAFYNALRYNGKNAVLLAYPGEGHGLRGLANRKDLTVRFFQFFNHYLKGAPAPKWMSEGVPFLKKDENKVTGNR